MRALTGSVSGRISLALLAVTLATAGPALTSHAASTSAAPVGAARAASTGGFLTIVMGRTAHAIVDRGCRQIPDAVPLTDVAKAFKAIGLKATGAVVTDWVGTGGVQCHHGAAYPTWDELAALRDNYGWTFFSEGPDHTDVRTMTQQQQYAYACGSLQTLAAHGHTRAWGMFAYPGGSPDKPMQAAVTQRCFAFGRTYLRPINTRDAVGRPPYFQHTRQITGGSCGNAALPCSKINTPRRYTSIATLETYMHPASTEWSALQAYKFVRGSYASKAATGPRWDCTAADSRAHWTSGTELYCLDDFLTAARTRGADVTVTDPAGVAQAWSPHPQQPTTSLTSGPGAGPKAVFTFRASDARSWFLCTLDGGGQKLCDSGVSYAALGRGSHTFSVRAISAYGVGGPAVQRTFWTG